MTSNTDEMSLHLVPLLLGGGTWLFEASKTFTKDYSPLPRISIIDNYQTVVAIVTLGVVLALVTNWEVGVSIIVVGSLATEFRSRTQSTPTNRFQIFGTRATAYLYEHI